MLRRNHTIHPVLLPFVPLVETVTKQFAPFCEVALHDLREPDHSLVAIDGELTRRPLGAPITNYVLRLLRENPEDLRENYVYETTGKDGRRFKSSTTFIRDGEGKILGCFCINFALDALLAGMECLRELCAVPPAEGPERSKEQFSNDVTDVAGAIMEEVLGKLTVPPAKLGKAEKIRVVQELESKGLFLVKGAVDIVAARLGVTKFTVYNYMERGKGN